MLRFLCLHKALFVLYFIVEEKGSGSVTQAHFSEDIKGSRHYNI